MNNTHQKRAYRNIAIAACVELLITIASIIYGMIVVIQNNELPNNIFELIFMGGHIVIVCFIIIISIEAIRKKPFILKTLTIDNEGNRRNSFSYGGLVLAVIGLGIIAVGILIITNVIKTSFPLFLGLDIANFGVTLVLIGLSLFLFPFAYAKDYIVEKIAKHKEKNL